MPGGEEVAGVARWKGGAFLNLRNGEKGGQGITLLRRRFEAMMATSSQVRLLTSKSSVRRG